jgi:hypothetical protein
VPYVRSSLLSSEYDGQGGYVLVYMLIDTDGVLPPSTETVVKENSSTVPISGASPSLLRAIAQYGSLSAVARHAAELGFSEDEISKAASVSGQSTTPGAWTPYKAPTAKDPAVNLTQYQKGGGKTPQLSVPTDEEVAGMLAGALEDLPWWQQRKTSLPIENPLPATPVTPATPKAPTPGLSWGDVASAPKKPGAYQNPAVASTVGEIMGEMAQKAVQETTVMQTNALPGYRPIKLRPRTR